MFTGPGMYARNSWSTRRKGEIGVSEQYHYLGRNS